MLLQYLGHRCQVEKAPVHQQHHLPCSKPLGVHVAAVVTVPLCMHTCMHACQHADQVRHEDITQHVWDNLAHSGGAAARF